MGPLNFILFFGNMMQIVPNFDDSEKWYLKYQININL